MFNDLRDEQSIIVYNTKSGDDDKCVYRGKVEDLGDELYGLLSTAASLYLLNDAEEYDIVAII